MHCSLTNCRCRANYLSSQLSIQSLQCQICSGDHTFDRNLRAPCLSQLSMLGHLGMHDADACYVKSSFAGKVGSKQRTWNVELWTSNCKTLNFCVRNFGDLTSFSRNDNFFLKKTHSTQQYSERHPQKIDRILKSTPLIFYLQTSYTGIHTCNTINIPTVVTELLPHHDHIIGEHWANSLAAQLLPYNLRESFQPAL